MISHTDAEIFVRRLNAMLVNNQFAEAEELLAASGNELPESIKFECLGNIEFYKKSHQSAVNFYESAIKLSPLRIISRYQYLVGVQEEIAGNTEEAIKRYSSAIDADRSFLDAYVELGGVLAKRDQLEIAAQCYRDAIKLAPEDARIHANLVTVLSRLAQRKPSHYSDELQVATKRYRDVAARFGIDDLSSHSW